MADNSGMSDASVAIADLPSASGAHWANRDSDADRRRPGAAAEPFSRTPTSGALPGDSPATPRQRAGGSATEDTGSWAFSIAHRDHEAPDNRTGGGSTSHGPQSGRPHPNDRPATAEHPPRRGAGAETLPRRVVGATTGDLPRRVPGTAAGDTLPAVAGSAPHRPASPSRAGNPGDGRTGHGPSAELPRRSPETPADGMREARRSANPAHGAGAPRRDEAGYAAPAGREAPEPPYGPAPPATGGRVSFGFTAGPISGSHARSAAPESPAPVLARPGPISPAPVAQPGLPGLVAQPAPGPVAQPAPGTVAQPVPRTGTKPERTDEPDPTPTPAIGDIVNGPGREIRPHRATRRDAAGRKAEGRAADRHQGDGRKGGRKAEGAAADRHQGDGRKGGRKAEGAAADGHQSGGRQGGRKTERHAGDSHQGDGRQGGGREAEGHAADGYRGDGRQGGGREAEGHAADGYRGDGRQGGGREADGRAANGHAGRRAKDGRSEDGRNTDGRNTDGRVLQGAGGSPARRRSRAATAAVVALAGVILLAGSVAGVVFFSGSHGDITSVLQLGAGSADRRTATAPLDGRTAASLDVVAGIGRLTVRSEDLGDQLYRITAADGSTSLPTPVLTDDQVRLHVTPDGNGDPGAVDVVLSAKVRWTLRFTGGADEQVIDLSGGQVGDVALTGAARKVSLTLPKPAGTVAVRVDGALDELSVKSPGDAPVRVRVESGAKTVTAGTRTLRDVAPGSTLTPRNWQVPDRYDLDAAARITLLRVEAI
ncbi:hypothetical protein KRMM14A1259_59250 [Krasilnikovia sp. MM14-A1259]